MPEDEEVRRNTAVERYIASKAEYFWGYVGALGSYDSDALSDMVSERFDYQDWLFDDKIPGLQVGQIDDEIETEDDLSSEDTMTEFHFIMENLHEIDTKDMKKIKDSGGLDEYEVSMQPYGIINPDSVQFSEIPTIIKNATRYVMESLDQDVMTDIILSVRDDHTRRPGMPSDESSGTFPVGETLSSVIKIAKEYVLVLKERIENEIRNNEAKNMESYLLMREIYYRFALGMFTEEISTLQELQSNITREGIIDRDVRQRDKNRALRVMFRYYYLKTHIRELKGEKEGISLLPSEVILHISGFIRNVWPDGHAEFELANSFETYVRKNKTFKDRFPFFALAQDVAIYPEEQKANLMDLMRHTESIVSGLIKTPADERRDYFEEKSSEINAMEIRIKKVSANYVFLQSSLSDIFSEFYDHLIVVTQENPQRINLKDRDTILNPIAPTEMRLERMHFVLEEIGRRDCLRFLKRMLQESANATQVQLEEFQKQRIAIRDAIMLGLKMTSPPKKRTRRVGYRAFGVRRARHLLDYSAVKTTPLLENCIQSTKRDDETVRCPLYF
ncbi:MAG: hypothetical protein ACTSUE_09820 [Promethearchaeota archaeon]